MKFQVSADLSYTTNEPSCFILSILAHSNSQIITGETLPYSVNLKVEEFNTLNENNRILRVAVENAMDVQISYKAEVQNSWRLVDFSTLTEMDISQMDPSILTYLYPSRYCQSDKLNRFANHEFGNIDNPFEKTVAITEWIYKHVEYLSGSTSSETSAYDTVTQQAGVCRDFAHLGIALCRALTIPARYCAAYAYQLIPQDFHACFEAYLGGQWIIFDATKLAPLNGLIKIAMGRDAADTAVASLFGDVFCNSIYVNCELIEGSFDPYYYMRENLTGITYY